VVVLVREIPALGFDISNTKDFVRPQLFLNTRKRVENTMHNNLEVFGNVVNSVFQVCYVYSIGTKAKEEMVKQNHLNPC